jgi:ribosomal protein L22
MEKVIYARIWNARVSLKDMQEVLRAIRRMPIKQAEEYLKRVQKERDFIPYLKHPYKGHKHGIPAGYPTKAIKQTLYLLHQLRANIKGLNGDPDNSIIAGFELGRGEYPRVFNGARLVKSHSGKRTNIAIYSKITIAEKQENKQESQTAQAPQPAENKEIKNENKN